MENNWIFMQYLLYCPTASKEEIHCFAHLHVASMLLHLRLQP